MPFGQHDAELVEQSTQFISLHDAHLHQLRSYAMQCQHHLLSLGLECHERLGQRAAEAAGGLEVLGVRRHRGAVDQAGGVPPPHGVAVDVVARHRLERLEDLELLVPDGLPPAGAPGVTVVVVSNGEAGAWGPVRQIDALVRG